MPSLTNPLINGIAWSFAEIEVTIDIYRFTAFKAINYKQSIERGVVRGNSMRPLAKTSGQISYEGDLEMYFGDYRALIESLGDGYFKKRFDIGVSYSNNDGVNPDIEIIYQDILKGCQIKGDEESHSQGTDGLTVKVPLDVMQILKGTASGLLLDGIGSATV